MSALRVSRSNERDNRRSAGPCVRYRDKVGSNAALFAAFVVHPVAYAVWLAVKPSLFIEMVEDPLYLAAIVNPLFFMGVGASAGFLPSSAEARPLPIAAASRTKSDKTVSCRSGKPVSSAISVHSARSSWLMRSACRRCSSASAKSRAARSYNISAT